MPMEQKMLPKPECMVISPSALPIRNLHREAEVIYVMHGVLEMQIGETVVTLEAGGLAYFAPNTIHQLYPERHPSRQAKLRFSTEWLLTPFTASQPLEPAEADALAELFSHSFITRSDPELSRIFLSMLKNGHGSYSPIALFMGILEMALHLLRSPDVIVRKIPNAQKQLPYFSAVYAYINNHYAHQLTLADLASYLGLSESYCSKYIHRMMGVPFIEYLNTVRVNQAQRMLAFTEAPITDIALKTGFTSSQSFCRTFRQKTGMTPTQYRQKRRLDF